MAQKLRKHGKKLEKTSVGCHIDFTILLSMLKVKPHFYILKNGVCRGIPIFLIFALKHRLWVLTCTIYVLSKNKKNIKIFLLKIFKFYNYLKICILHGHVLVMEDWGSNTG